MTRASRWNDRSSKSDRKRPIYFVRKRIAQAFMRSTSELKKGERMVCDLQGCFDSVQKRIGPTDPCILSKHALGASASGERLSSFGVQTRVVSLYLSIARYIWSTCPS